MTASASSTSPVSTPAARHAIALERRQQRLARDRASGAPAEVLAAHEAAIVDLTKAARRSEKRVDRLHIIRAKAEELKAKKADNAQLEERLAAKQAREDADTLKACDLVLARIERRSTAERSRRKMETRADRRRASLLRKNPHVERDSAIQVGRRIVTDPESIGKFVEVQVNKQLDVLTMEHSASPRRISDVEFAVGRLLQDAWTGRRDGDGRMEAIARLGILSGPSGDDGPLPAREMGMLREVFRVRAVADLDAKLADVVGWVGVRFLKAILVEGHTFKTYAGCTVGGGERGVARIGDRFRWLLGAVADALHTATGAEGQRIRASRDPA